MLALLRLAYGTNLFAGILCLTKQKDRDTSSVVTKETSLRGLTQNAVTKLIAENLKLRRCVVDALTEKLLRLAGCVKVVSKLWPAPSLTITRCLVCAIVIALVLPLFTQGGRPTALSIGQAAAVAASRCSRWRG